MVWPPAVEVSPTHELNRVLSLALFAKQPAGRGRICVEDLMPGQDTGTALTFARRVRVARLAENPSTSTARCRTSK